MTRPTEGDSLMFSLKCFHVLPNTTFLRVPQSSCTAGERHAFSGENISFNKAPSKADRKWEIFLNTASPHSSFCRHNGFSPKNTSPASHRAAVKSQMFGFPVLSSCCRGKPLSHCQWYKHPPLHTHRLPVEGWKLSHINKIARKKREFIRTQESLHNLRFLQEVVKGI